MTIDQKSRFAEKIMDWGNLFFAGLVLAQFVPKISEFNWILLLIGAIGLVISYSLAYHIMKR